ncbi:hypothetical protein [Halobacillus amylolyticus]|uniref:Uncharacterized protein n=1 Tax=Halobacillus amylolyticus TaxID=2932259 RepID=A0ABY4HBZ0_9BACI|nr:hypothetical protein [Halobacillus amylolyticus]UOR12076.1 hypothetical protein MUO15_00580 [Halobacillus amylolyticus]
MDFLVQNALSILITLTTIIFALTVLKFTRAARSLAKLVISYGVILFILVFIMDVTSEYVKLGVIPIVTGG